MIATYYQECPKGYYNNKEGARQCTPCRLNTYQPNTGKNQCLPCASGYSTRGLTGQSACQVVRSKAPLRLSMY